MCCVVRACLADRRICFTDRIERYGAAKADASQDELLEKVCEVTQVYVVILCSIAEQFFSILTQSKQLFKLMLLIAWVMHTSLSQAKNIVCMWRGSLLLQSTHSDAAL